MIFDSNKFNQALKFLCRINNLSPTYLFKKLDISAHLCAKLKNPLNNNKFTTPLNKLHSILVKLNLEPSQFVFTPNTESKPFNIFTDYTGKLTTDILKLYNADVITTDSKAPTRYFTDSQLNKLKTIVKSTNAFIVYMFGVQVILKEQYKTQKLKTHIVFYNNPNDASLVVYITNSIHIKLNVRYFKASNTVKANISQDNLDFINDDKYYTLNDKFLKSFLLNVDREILRYTPIFI